MQPTILVSHSPPQTFLFSFPSHHLKIQLRRHSSRSQKLNNFSMHFCGGLLLPFQSKLIPRKISKYHFIFKSLLAGPFGNLRTIFAHDSECENKGIHSYQNWLVLYLQPAHTPHFYKGETLSRTPSGSTAEHELKSDSLSFFRTQRILF